MIISRRHTRLGLTTRVFRTVAEIPAADWNAVFPDVLESYAFFKTLDECGITQFSFYYIMVYERRRPVGATACFSLNYSLDTTINGPVRRATNAIKRFAPHIFSLRAFVCGMPIGQGRIGTASNRDAVARAIMRRIEQLAKKTRAAVIAYKDFDQTYTPLLDPLQRRGFTKFDGLPTTMMNIWYKNFEEYLHTLSGATRYDLRRKFKKVDHDVALHYEVVDVLSPEVLDEVYRLYLNIIAKHDMSFELLPRTFFEKIAINMAGNVRFFLWRIDGKIVAFLFALVSDTMFIDYYVGLDYAVAHKYHLYFIKFRDVLRWCIEHNIPQYEMGITGYEPKRRLGFDTVPLYLYVKLRNRALRPVFNFICQFLKFDHFDPDLRAARKHAKHAHTPSHA